MYKVILLKTKYKNINFYGYARVKTELKSSDYKLIKDGNKYYLEGNNNDKIKAIIYHGKNSNILNNLWKNYTINNPKITLF